MSSQQFSWYWTSNNKIIDKLETFVDNLSEPDSIITGQGSSFSCGYTLLYMLSKNFNLFSFGKKQQGLRIIEKLLKKGASPNKYCRGTDTPFNIVIKESNPELVELFLKYGANPNQDNNQEALYNASTHGSCSKKNIDVVILLLKYGLNQHQKNKYLQGMSVFEKFQKYHKSILKREPINKNDENIHIMYHILKYGPHEYEKQRKLAEQQRQKELDEKEKQRKLAEQQRQRELAEQESIKNNKFNYNLILKENLNIAFQNKKSLSPYFLSKIKEFLDSGKKWLDKQEYDSFLEKYDEISSENPDNNKNIIGFIHLSMAIKNLQIIPCLLKLEQNQCYSLKDFSKQLFKIANENISSENKIKIRDELSEELKCCIYI